MPREYFNAYHSYLDSMKRLSDAEVGRLFRALLKYSMTGTLDDLPGNEKFVADGMTAQIDRDSKKYDEKCKKNKQNRCSAKKNGLTTADERQQTSTTVDERQQGKGEGEGKDKGEGKGKGERDSRARAAAGGIAPVSISGIAIHPTFDQVLEYAKLRGAEQCARPFFDYYSAANWRDGQNIPVYNWQQKFIAWQMREEEKQKKSGGRSTGKAAFDAQPTYDRIQKNNDWLDEFLKEQREKGDI